MEKTSRVKWIDVAKFLGIFAIYIGHLGAKNVGETYYFVFMYHVPLFFLISGCLENYNSEKNFVRYLIHKIKTIMLPFWFFAACSFFIESVRISADVITMKQMIKEVALGVVRNTFQQGISLWFLSCLFIMQIMFFVIKKINYKSIILVICLILHYVYNIGTSYYKLPHLPYNIDSAFQYIIYFAIGYTIFPYIKKLFELDSDTKKMVYILSGGGSLIYAASVFWGKDFLDIFSSIFVLKTIMVIVKTLVLIWLNLVIARTLQDVYIFSEIGRDTLYMCGSERLIKILFPSFMSLFGIGITIGHPIVAYIYTMVLLLLAYKLLLPIEKCVLNRFVRKK